MTHRKKNLPIGMENFEEIRTNNFYYVDKTGLIRDLLNSPAKVTLFTRPRRFGKSLNMSMLKAFFSSDTDKKIFDGLEISKEKELCEKYMGKYPVIFLSLKSLEGGSYEIIYQQMVNLINREAAKVYRQVGDSEKLLPEEKERLRILQGRSIDEADLYESLYTLSELLEKHYGRRTIILIDEYDVPLAKACEDGYYDQMVRLIRNFFHRALKTNTYLEFAVLTGCMRVSKESIFTGLNNLRVLGISDERADESFGFTDQEVRDLLAYYNISDKYEEVREWYDGYRFGNENVYCPWDVINFCDYAGFSTNSFPKNFWVNSSGNSIVREMAKYIGRADVKGELEALINGEPVEKTIREELTYADMYASVENIWSVLYTTGYLTKKEQINASRLKLVIPNREVRDIFAGQILEMFREDVARDGEAHVKICSALEKKDVSGIEKALSEYLRKTISIRDAAVRRTLTENFYHGILLAILSVKSGWSVTSNEEAGDGYSDILVRFNNYELAMIIEVKYADNSDMDAVCKKALRQIEKKNYAQRLYDDGFEHILKYGIAFRLKKCRVMLQEEN